MPDGEAVSSHASDHAGDPSAGSVRGRNVVLTGFMGTGKSTVGRLLARRLGYEFVDTDDLIVARHGPIRRIFAEHGEARFRGFESELAAELAGRSGLVIATGGRMMLDAVNADLLARNARIVCLTASVDTIVARVAPSGVARHRPLLEGHDDVRRRVRELLAERAGAYARFPQVSTDDRSPEQVCDVILGLLTPV